MVNQIILNSLGEAKVALDQLMTNTQTIDHICKAAQLLITTFESEKKVFSCGNGGSMCDAMHFAEEMTGQYRKPRRGFPVIAISDPAHLTCVSNDFGFEEVFSRYISSHGQAGDCLIAISTSGSSPNIIKALTTAHCLDMRVIGLGGRLHSPLMEKADIPICIPTEFSDRAQEIHIKILHIFIEMIERHFCSENYIDNLSIFHPMTKLEVA